MNQVTISEERYDQLKAAERMLESLEEYKRLKELSKNVMNKYLDQTPEEKKGARS